MPFALANGLPAVQEALLELIEAVTIESESGACTLLRLHV